MDLKKLAEEWKTQNAIGLDDDLTDSLVALLKRVIEDSKSLWHYYPHMCRDGHEELGFRSDDELCPVDKALAQRDAEVERLKEEKFGLIDAAVTLRERVEAALALMDAGEIVTHSDLRKALRGGRE